MDYYKYKNKLDLKKEKYFSQDLSKWEMDKNLEYDRNSLYENKTLAFSVMFSKVIHYVNYFYIGNCHIK
jgi:hypothetical protein